MYLQNNGNQFLFKGFPEMDKLGLTLFGIKAHPLYLTCYHYCVEQKLFDKKTTIPSLFNVDQRFHWILQFYGVDFSEFIQKMIFNKFRAVCLVPSCCKIKNCLYLENYVTNSLNYSYLRFTH